MIRQKAPLNIGILTFHRCINYGSYWQARCLAEGLQARGHRVSILDHYSRRVNIAEWKCAFRPVMPTPVPESDHSLYREKMHRFFRAFEALPLSSRFPLEDPSGMEDYDIVIVGSDEVWNLFHPWYGKCPLFYGDGLRASHLVSYAASFGNYDASWGLNATWGDKLRNFALLSVRDDNSRLMVRNAIGIEPEMVLDPCLQFAIPLGERHLEPLQEPYIAVYGHNFSESFIRHVRQTAALRGLSLISIGYRNDWADEQWITAGPEEFAPFMARSEAVVTNFFHGCVFALRYAKPFICETSPYRINKIQGLMTKIGGEHHLLGEASPAALFQDRLSEPIAPGVLQRVAYLRQTSDGYLNRALALKQPTTNECTVKS